MTETPDTTGQSTKKNFSRRDFMKVAGVVTGSSLLLSLGLSGDTPQPRQSVENETKTLDPRERLGEYLQIKNEGLETKNQDNFSVINNPESTDEDFAKAIKKWHGDKPIFVFLDNPESKSRFIGKVLEENKVNKHKYETHDPGPDVDGDGVSTIRVDNAGNVINELEEVIDQTSYICSDFSVDLGNQIGLNPEMEYNKLTLPLFCVTVSPSHYESAGKPGHAMNAVFLGDKNQVSDHQSWLFIEPQNDQIVLDPLNHWVSGQALWIHTPGKDLKSTFDVEQNGLFGFMASPDNKSRYGYGVTRDEMIMIEQMEAYFYEREYPITIDGKPSYVHFLDFTKFGPDQVNGVLRLATYLKYFSEDKISSALKDAKLPEGYNYVP